jgi:Cu(I)/Ag(I) efflux system membrane protein CusA/SilA
MIDKIIEFCAHNKFITLFFVIILTMIGWWCIKNIPLDAIPDLTDTQVIVYSRWDRSPDIIEDQVTYPITSALLGAPKVKDIRGFSDFGFSYVYVIFEDGTDIYWARTRVLEYLSKITPRLPEGVKVELGPDATGLGWVYQYALVDTTRRHSIEELRSLQDWYLRYYLQSVKGVAEVATIGGYQKQYQINVDPNLLSAYNVAIDEIVNAVRKSNQDVGGRLIEFSGREFMVRGKGYIKSPADIENIVIKAKNGVPVLVKNVARVEFGPEIRRGVSDLDGTGEAVSGIVVMRYGENALKVIDRVKQKIKEIEPGLPEGVQLVTVYDRSELINRSIDTLKGTLKEELIIVSIIILLFLLHIPSAMIPIVTLPIAVIISFIPMYGMGLTSNIMSLGGIAIAIGAMVDAAIVVVEQTHKKLEHWELAGRKEDYRNVIISAVKEVGRPSFFALLVIAVSFIPIFALEAQEGRLFKPLAFTKTFAMIFAAILAITLDPALRLLFFRLKKFTFRPKFFAGFLNVLFIGKFEPEEKHPISKILQQVYHPVIELVLRFKWSVILIAILIVLVTIPIFMKLGSEFMPPLYEGTILYMPTTLPGISVTETAHLLQIQDKVLKSFPEVDRVYGKAGRAETATDPAPFSMMETVVVLKPESEWRAKPVWYSRMPEFIKKFLRHIWRDRISHEELISEMNQKMQFPGVSNAWTMPIKARIDMLSTGIRTPVGIKIYGADLKKIEEIGQHIEIALKEVKGTRSVFSERVAGGYFIDFEINREAIARYGLKIDDVNMVIMSAVGGENITTTVEGRERYPVNLRYKRELRDDIDKLKRILVPVPSATGGMGGFQVPLAELCEIKLVSGPAMIRDENGLLSGYVYIDVTDRDIGSYVNEAKKVVREKVSLPAGYSLSFSGQYEFMERVKQRLTLVVPITILIIFVLLYMNTRSVVKTFIIFLAVPFSAVGAILFLYLLNYNLSIAVWVGLIALLGVDAETGIFMLLYLDLAYEDRKKKGLMNSYQDLKDAIIDGAVKRVRPKVMTVATMFIALFPIMWSTGTGSDVMKRIAAPMVGGIFTSFIMELCIYPVIYEIWKWYFDLKPRLPKEVADSAEANLVGESA